MLVSCIYHLERNQSLRMVMMTKEAEKNHPYQPDMKFISRRDRSFDI